MIFCGAKNLRSLVPDNDMLNIPKNHVSRAISDGI
jgi:phenylalanyl-tRNA synthetase alpha subunit